MVLRPRLFPPVLAAFALPLVSVYPVVAFTPEAFAQRSVPDAVVDRDADVGCADCDGPVEAAEREGAIPVLATVELGYFGRERAEYGLVGEFAEELEWYPGCASAIESSPLRARMFIDTGSLIRLIGAPTAASGLI